VKRAPVYRTRVVPIGVRAREAGGCSPQVGKSYYFFRANAKFFVQKPAAAKNEKKYFVGFLLKEKNAELIP